MSNEKDNGGPAFAVHPEIRDNEPHAGMTLRDYFAAGIAASTYGGAISRAFIIGPAERQRIAEGAYLMADELIAERSK